MRAARSAVLAAAALLAASCSAPAADQPAARSNASTAATSPRPAPSPATWAAPTHTLVVMLENHSYGEVIGNRSAPFLNKLARAGALFTHSRAITHPSEPNYLALFSGSTQGVTGDACPYRFNRPNLGSELLAAGHTFAGYAEGLPGTGSPVCYAGNYARRHVPWVNFSNLPRSVNLPWSAFPAGDFARLPTVSFVVPDLCHDMHDCPVATGDAWLKEHIGPYAAWAMTHNSLLIVDFDENDGSPGNRIPTIFYGQRVRPGRDGQPVTHYSVLRTIEDWYGLRPLGHAATARPITGILRSA